MSGQTKCYDDAQRQTERLMKMKREPQVGDVVKYSRPERGEADFRFLLKEHNGDRVAIELICTERIRPIEVVAANQIEVA
jgi:hypothetical protein